MKYIKLFEQFINEIEFKDAESFKAYTQKHKMRPTTIVNIAGKDIKAGDVGKEEKEEETEESAGTTGFIKPNSMEKDKPYLYARYKDTLYSFQDNGGWTEAYMNDARKKELEDFKVPFAQAVKSGEIRSNGSADKFLKELGLKKEDPKETEKKEAIKNQIEEFDEDKDYPKVKASDADDKAFKEIAKDEEIQDFLGYLVHDKSHVMDNDEEVPEMTKIFKATKDVEFEGSLFRGMYSASPKDFKVGDTKSFGRYQSFSESPGVAKGFSGTKEDQGVVLKVDNPKGGLNYAAWLEKNMDQNDEDNSEVMKTSRFEKEHVFDRNQKYKVTKVEDSKPFTIVHIEFI
jgi:hypothetical protein